jgi:hypothetical protein
MLPRCCRRTRQCARLGNEGNATYGEGATIRGISEHPTWRNRRLADRPNCVRILIRATRLLATTIATIALPFAMLSSVNVATAQAASIPSVAGSWTVAETNTLYYGTPCTSNCYSPDADTYTFTQTAPNTYSISNASGFETTGVTIAASASGASASTCWIGSAMSGGVDNSGCPGDGLVSCPSCSYFEVPMNFSFPAGGPNTITGTIDEYSYDGDLQSSWTYTATQTSCTAAGGCGAEDYTVSGTLTRKTCTADGCTSDPASGVTVAVTSNDGGGISTSGVSDAEGDWSVDVPDGGYTVTPHGAGWDPASADETVSDSDVDDVDFTETENEYEVSGTVSEHACGDSSCSPPSGLGGVTVLVKGTASDGTPVSESDVSDDADGSWSVEVPPGSYVAGPSDDGETFGGLGFGPSSTPVDVTDTDFPNVNFAACDVGGSSQADAGDLPQARVASVSTTGVGQCTSVYTVRMGGVIDQKQLVDPGEGARYDTNEDGNPDYRDSSGWLDGFKHLFPFLLTGGHREYPSCPTDFPEAEVAGLEKKGWTGADIRWYSYIEGPANLSPVTVKFAYNQSNGEVSLLGDPVDDLSEAKITKVWKWVEYGKWGYFGGAVNYGTCRQTEEIPALVFPVPEQRTKDDKAGFTMVVAWGFPFSGSGAQTLLRLDKDEFEEAVERAGAGEDKHIATYWEQAGYDGKFALQLAVMAWGVSKGLKLLEVGAEHTAVKKWVGEQAAKYAGKFAGVAEHTHQATDVNEVTEWLDAFSNKSGYMMAVIRGQFEPVLSDHGTSVASILALSYATSKFPNITLSISRQAFAFPDDRNPPFSGTLPWANTPLGTATSPAVSNPLAGNPDGYLVLNEEDYTSGEAALKKLREATSESLSSVTYSIKAHGNLAWNFENEQRETGVAPPLCPETLPEELISKGDDPNTICWRFNDGDA